jgi:hypothetical protein
MRTWRLDLDGDAHAPHLARHSVAAWLELLDCTETVRRDVTILTSEFVTTAVMSHATVISVRLLFDDGRLRMDVYVGGIDPLQGPASGPGGSRRSISTRVADAVADDWGQGEGPSGTHLWAEILC